MTSDGRNRTARERAQRVTRPALRIFQRSPDDADGQRLQAAVNQFLTKCPLGNLLSHQVIVDSGMVVAVSVLYSYEPREQRDERW